MDKSKRPRMTRSALIVRLIVTAIGVGYIVYVIAHTGNQTLHH